MTGRLAGKVALVTGAARGQGRSHALRLAGEGADIIAVDIAAPIASVTPFYDLATPAEFAQTVADIEALDRRVVWRQADVRDGSALCHAVEAGVRQLGHLDIVVANAGIFLHGHKVHEVTEEQWDDELGVNLKGVWLTMKAAVPVLIEQGTGGAIVITGSTASHRGIPNVAPYAASKHGLVGLMRTMANELAPYKVRVNMVDPTTVATPLVQNAATYRLFVPGISNPSMDDAIPAFTALNPLGVPWVDPADVSNAVLFLVSDEARYISGSELKVDAGSLNR